MIHTIQTINDICISKGSVLITKEYINCRQKLEIICNKGHTFHTTAVSINQAHWCKFCANEKFVKDSSDRIKKEYEINNRNNFFSTDSEESFYTAGFWAADGTKYHKNNSYTVACSLAAKDKSHLFKLGQLIDPSVILYESKHFDPKKTKLLDRVEFRVNCKQLFEDLEKFGVTEKKTYTMNLPEWLLKHKMFNHFLRGYIDGDGCFCEVKKTKSIMFCMRGTAVFLNQIHKILKDSNIVNYEKILKPKTGKRKIVFNTLQYNNIDTIKKLYNYLYGDANIYLARKKEIAEKILLKNNLSKSVVIDNVYNSAYNTISKDTIMFIAKQYKTQVEVAEQLNIASSALLKIIKKLNIKNEFKTAIKGFDENDVVELHKKNIKKAEIAKLLKISKIIVHRVIKNFNK